MKKIISWFKKLNQITKEQITEDILIKMFRFGLYLQENKNIDGFMIDYSQSDYSFSIMIDIGAKTIPFNWFPKEKKSKNMKQFFDEIENYINQN